VCAIPSCHNPDFIDTRPGHVALCCSNRHQILYAALSNTPLCDLTDCFLPVLIDSEGTVHEYCCWDHAVVARDRGEVQFSQDRPIAPAGTNACVHPGCDRTPVDFSIFCGRTHAYAHTRAFRGLLPPSPPPSPPQSPRPSAGSRVDARSAHDSQPAPAPVRFFSGVWHMSHAAWNKLQHALHGNSPPLPTQPSGDPLRPAPTPRPTSVTTAPRPGHATDAFLLQLAEVARHLAENSGSKRCALPGCQKLVSFDLANPQQRNDYCGQVHARKSHLSLDNRDFVLTPAMRACATCGQRHLDRDCPAMRPCAVCHNRHLARDCPRIMLSDPGAPATSRHPATPGTVAAPAAAAAAANTARPATPGAPAPLPAAAHTAAVVTAAAGTAHPAAPGAAAASSDTDGPGAANVEAPPPGPNLLDQGPDTVAAAPPSRPPALSPRGR